MTGIGFEVSIRGAEAAGRAIPGTTEMERLIDDALTEWGKETLDGHLYGMANYAPPPPNSTYVRTGALGADWGLRRAGKMAIAFTNNMHYAGYVVGQQQAAIHAGRWWIALERIRERLDKLTAKIADKVGARI